MRLRRKERVLYIIDKRENNFKIIDVAIPEDGRQKAKKEEKVKKYQDLARDNRKTRGERAKLIAGVIGMNSAFMG